MSFISWFIIFCLCFISDVHCKPQQQKSNDSSHRYLVLIPFNARSHKNMFVPLITALANRGHFLRVVSMFRSDELSSYTNVIETVINLKLGGPDIVKNIGESAFTKPTNPFIGFIYSLDHWPEFCAHILSLENIQQLILNLKPGDYDAILLDAFVSECFLPFAHLADVPIIQVAPSHLMPWHYTILNTPIYYAQDAVFFLPHSDHKSWTERCEAVILGMTAHAVREWVYLPRLQRVIDKSLSKTLGPSKAASVPPVWDIEESRTELMLVNWHWSLGTFVRPNPPNIVEVVCMHCRTPNPLPQQLEDFVSKSGEEGFIIFSLGSTIPGHKLPVQVCKDFLAVFAKLPQRVIWKFETQLSAEIEIPKNVLLVPWLPQQDLLGDPRIQAFVTQAGMMSLQEAIWHGIPILAVPLIVDQFANAALVKQTGLGLQLNLHQVTTQQLHSSIQELVTNKSYRSTAQRMSRLMRDQPELPQDRAVWWVEYTVRHRGTRHLRAPTLHFVQRHLLDVALPMLALLVIALVMAVRICKRCVCCQMTKIKQHAE